MTQFGSWGRGASTMRLGLDVGSSGVKLVGLSRRSTGGWTLMHAAVEPLPAGAVVDGQVEQFDAVAQAVRQAVARSGVRVRDVALALPPAAVIRRTLRVPFGLGEAALEAQVAQGAAGFLPFPLDDVCLDFSFIPGALADADGCMGVHLAAARRDRVLDRQALAEAAGLRAVCLDVESCAAYRVFAAQGAGQDTGKLSAWPADALVGLFDLGARTARLQVLRHHESLYEGEQPLTRSENGDAPSTEGGSSAEASGGVAAALAQDIAQAVQVFLHSTAHRSLDRLVLAGGAAMLPGLAVAVAAQSGLPCSVLQPFEGMALGKGFERGGVDPVRDAPRMAIACGLALRDRAP